MYTHSSEYESTFVSVQLDAAGQKHERVLLEEMRLDFTFLLSRPNLGIFQLSRIEVLDLCFDFLDQSLYFLDLKTVCFDHLDQILVCFDFFD